MKTIKKQGFYTVLAALLLFSLSSCSRGYGCPYDFSVGKTLGTIISNGIGDLAKLF